MIGRKARDTTDDLLAHPLDSKRQAGRPAALFFAGGTSSELSLNLVAAAAYASNSALSVFWLARASTQSGRSSRSRLRFFAAGWNHSFLPRRLWLVGSSMPCLPVSGQALLIVKTRNGSGPAASDHKGRRPFLSPTVEECTAYRHDASPPEKY